MGGLFRAPRPVVVEPPPPPPTAPAPAPSPAAVTEASRDETRRRAPRGLAGTIATSPRGVLEPAAPLVAAGRRSLLGE